MLKNKQGKLNVFGFSVELFGALTVSVGVFTIPLKIFSNELISELIIALGTIVMIAGRFLR